MKKLTQLTALSFLLVGANAYAHHPAADIVDPEVYEMIDENISDAHLALTFDDMGGNTTDAGSVMQGRDSDIDAEMGGNLADVGAAMEAREDMNAMADAVQSGSMGSQR